MSIIDLIYDARHLCMRFGTDFGIKAMPSGISRGRGGQVKTFTSTGNRVRVCYSIKTGRRFNSHAKYSVRVSTSSTSLLSLLHSKKYQ